MKRILQIIAIGIIIVITVLVVNGLSRKKPTTIEDGIVHDKQIIIDSTAIMLFKEIEALKTANTRLSEYSNKLIIKIRNHEKRPNFDLDFNTAFSIIANSNYRPDKPDNNAGQGEND